jgi:PAS domain S-box-containing protein
MTNMSGKKKKIGVSFTPTEAILESISDGVFTVDSEWRVTSFNRAAEDITGIPRREAIGRRCSEVFRSSICGAECALQKTLKTGRPIIGQSGYIINAAGNRIPISVSTAVLRDADVLVLGESGTGKELISRTIHTLSPRRKGPFIAVNCGALPDTLLESELFGYKAGAFTGAAKDKPGRFALARGGTLFLDEIGEVSPALQVRLLRVLQERSYEPLGSVRSEQTDARIIVATHKDLAEETRRGAFREDLYYRVNVVRVELPPLRRRKEDIPLLAAQFIERFNRLQGRAVAGISAEALSLLMAHAWPGNVRELENVIERSFIMCGDGLIGIEHLPEELTAHGVQACADFDVRSAHDLLDAQSIRTALERSGYNRQAAARELGIHKSTLFRRIKKLGIALPKQDGRSRRTRSE